MQKLRIRVMLNQPEGMADAFRPVFRMRGPVRALMIGHQLQARREVIRISGKLLFEPGRIGLLQFQDIT